MLKIKRNSKIYRKNNPNNLQNQKNVMIDFNNNCNFTNNNYIKVIKNN